MVRKPPVRHSVKSYQKGDGTSVRQHTKGTGSSKQKSRVKKVVGDDLEDLYNQLYVAEGNDDWDESDRIVGEIAKRQGWKLVESSGDPMWVFERRSTAIEIDMTGGRGGTLPIHISVYRIGDDLDTIERLPIIWDKPIKAVRESVKLMKKYR